MTITTGMPAAMVLHPAAGAENQGHIEAFGPLPSRLHPRWPWRAGTR